MLEQPEHLLSLKNVGKGIVLPTGEPTEAVPTCYRRWCLHQHPETGPECFGWPCHGKPLTHRHSDGLCRCQSPHEHSDGLCRCYPSQRAPHQHHIIERQPWSRPGIYILVDPPNRLPRYVGQTTNLCARLQHWANEYRLSPWEPLVWLPWLPTQGWTAKQASPHRQQWSVHAEPWLVEKLLRAEARAIAHFRTQGAPLLNVTLRETLLS
jgi:hypothetical protein